MIKDFITGKSAYELEQEGNPVYRTDKTRLEARGDFRFGRSEPCRTCICTVCGGDQWLVGGVGSLTVIKCPNCGHEVVAWDGD